MSNREIARAAFADYLAEFRDLDEINTRVVALEQRGLGNRAEREDLRRDLDRERLVNVWNMLSALFACELDTDPRSDDRGSVETGGK